MLLVAQISSPEAGFVAPSTSVVPRSSLWCMVAPDPYKQLLELLAAKLVVLPDKPEESPEVTLRALWLKASGTPASAELASATALRSLSDDEVESLQGLVAQRLAGVPLAHLTGRQRFMGLELLAGPQALVPRKETELLGATALARATGDESMLVLDVCTGSGNLAIAVARSLPKVTVHAADLAEDAVELARENVRFAGVEPSVSVWTGDLFAAFPEELQGRADLVICNPPYISSGRVDAMDAEISAHEPRLAFDGGSFGLAIISRLIADAPAWMKPGGWLCFEIGLGQGPHWVKALSRRTDYDLVEPAVNADGDVRAIAARRSGRA